MRPVLQPRYRNNWSTLQERRSTPALTRGSSAGGSRSRRPSGESCPGATVYHGFTVYVALSF